MRRNGQTTFENFWTTKNIHFGTKHDVFGPKFGFLPTLTTYIEVWGHMIAQNDPLDEYKKLCYRKFFLAHRKKWPLGSENGHFWPKTSSFGQKWRFLVVQKFSKKIFFSFFLHFRAFLIVFNESKKNFAPSWPLFWPFWPPFQPLLAPLLPYFW